MTWMIYIIFLTLHYIFVAVQEELAVNYLFLGINTTRRTVVLFIKIKINFLSFQLTKIFLMTSGLGSLVFFTL